MGLVCPVLPPPPLNRSGQSKAGFQVLRHLAAGARLVPIFLIPVPVPDTAGGGWPSPLYTILLAMQRAIGSTGPSNQDTRVALEHLSDFVPFSLSLETRGYKEMSLCWLTNSALVYEPKCGGGVPAQSNELTRGPTS